MPQCSDERSPASLEGLKGTSWLDKCHPALQVLADHPQAALAGDRPPYQVSELSGQAAVGGLLHVHDLGVRAQDVELPEPA